MKNVFFRSFGMACFFLCISSASAQSRESASNVIPEPIRNELIAGKYRETAPKLQSLAKAGNKEAAFFVGHMYICGKGLRFSCANAIQMFRSSFDHEEASPTDPSWAKSARSEIAWAHAACMQDGFERDGKLALKLASSVAKHAPDPYQLDTLAAANANLGNYKSAIIIQRNAIAKLTETASQFEVPPKTFKAFESRLKLYKLGKPARFSESEAEAECNALP